MADRVYARSRDEKEHDLQMQLREAQCIIRTLVHSAGCRDGEITTLRVPSCDFISVDTFSPLSIRKDEFSGDVLFCLGAPELAPQWKPASKQPDELSQVEQLRLLLWKASPHLVNGANGHPTDRYNANLILREMRNLGMTEERIS